MIEPIKIHDTHAERLRTRQNDTFAMKGVFKCRAVNRNGVVVFEYGNNLIVNAGKHEVARLIGGARTTGVTKIGLGTGSAAAAAGDTTLTSMFSKAVSAVAYPSNGQVRFDWFIDYGEANGLNVREFGLLFSDDTLFARFVRGSAILKDSDITLEGEWTIYT